MEQPAIAKTTKKPAAKKAASAAADPTEPMRAKARSFPDAIEGSSCTQASFKVGKKAFLYVGMQGGRYKAMFKLDASMPKACEFAESRPDDFQTGSTGWVTARFTADKPLAKRKWEKWLSESYALATPKPNPKPAAKPASKKK